MARSGNVVGMRVSDALESEALGPTVMLGEWRVAATSTRREHSVLACEHIIEAYNEGQRG